MSFTPDHRSLIAILEKCEDFDWTGGTKEPRAKISVRESDLPHLKRLMDNARITECFADGKNLGTDSTIVPSLTGKTVKLDFQLPIPKQEAAIVKDLDALLEHKEFLTRIPSHSFFILDKSYGVTREYSHAVSFFNLLKQTSDHHDQSGHEFTCFFYDGVKITIPIKYSCNDLCILEGIDALKESFSAPRLKERLRIFRTAITKTALSAQSEDYTFVHLLNSFSKINKSYEQDWNFYLSDFSLEEILKELEETILDIANKLTTALSDLQKTMITIPLAIIFAAPRIDTDQIQTTTNAIIVASVWIFALFTWVFFTNHKRTLHFIKEEIEEQEESCLEKHKGLEEKIQHKFNGLKERCRYQTFYRKAVGSIMWAAVIIVTLIFFSPQLTNNT